MSLFLTIIYLLKDMFHRWLSHLASPVARICVVFLLTLCALIILTNFLVAEKLVSREIERTGATLVIVSESVSASENARENAFSDSSSVELNELFLSAKIGDEYYPLVEYPIGGAKLFSGFPVSDNGVFIFPKVPTDTAFPETFEVGEYLITGLCVPVPEEPILRNIYRAGAIFIPDGMMDSTRGNGFLRKTFFDAGTADPARVAEIETAIQDIIRLDGSSAHVQSSRKFLERLARIRGDQAAWRIALSLGIAFIVGVLLTAISSMEFQRNAFVYALMNSFGVNRILLIFSFFFENFLLAFGAFALALGTFFKFLPLILDEVFKTRSVDLAAAELMPDIRLIAISLCVCVFISTLPIAFSAFKQIGKVLR